MPIQNTMRVLNDMSDSKMLSVMSKMSHKVLVQVTQFTSTAMKHVLQVRVRYTHV